MHEVSMGAGRGHIDFWIWNESPAPLSGTTMTATSRTISRARPRAAICASCRAQGREPDYDAAKDPHIVPPHPIKVDAHGRRWDRGGTTAYSGGMHKTETVDYAILLDGERTLVLDDGEVKWNPGDIVIDVGAWHQWKSYGPEGGRVVYDMIAARIRRRPGRARAGQRQDHARRQREAAAGCKARAAHRVHGSRSRASRASSATARRPTCASIPRVPATRRSACG